MNQEKRRILIVGAGAIGGYVGGLLALAGHDVSFLATERTARVLNRDGLLLDLPVGRREARPQALTPTTIVGLREEPDLVIIAVKRYDTIRALEPLGNISLGDAAVLSLQNGIGSEAEIETCLGGRTVVPGTMTTAVSRPAPNHVVVEKMRGVGIAGAGQTAQVLTRVFTEAGLNAAHYPDAAAMKWSKLLTNLIANASSAILDYSPRQVFTHRGLFKLEMQQLRETLKVMKALRTHVVDLPGTPVKLLAFGASRLPYAVAQPLMAKPLISGRGEKMPSFHVDLHGGSGQSEVEAYNGSVVRYGEQFRIDTPVNTTLLKIMIGMLGGDIRKDAYRHRPDLLLGAVRGMG